MKYIFLACFLLSLILPARSQDTFSIVAVDSVTGEIGSAGASCVDLFNFPGYPVDFLGELFPGKGAINTQAAYDASNQAEARARMNAGDSPDQIISWMMANDINNDPSSRQYGIVRLVNNSPKTAGFTGTNCLDYKNHIAGKNYCIQGNILLGQKVLDSMEARFLREPGNLSCKLMAALQGAKMVGADTRCAANGSSSLFAFVKVCQPTDSFNKPSFIVTVKTHNGDHVEPVDSLQKLFTAKQGCFRAGIQNKGNDQSSIQIFPNPCTDQIRIVSVNFLEINCKIMDHLGKIVYEGNIKNGDVIDVKNLDKGIYIIRFDSGEVRRFVKI